MALDFPPSWVQLIMTCISTVTYRISMGSHVAEVFIPGKGIWQGDPLSPFPSIIRAEGFTSLVRSFERRGCIHGYMIARNAPPITSLLFADDCLLTFQAERGETETLKQILNIYGQASRLDINYQKSTIMFSTNTQMSIREGVCDILQVRETIGQLMYLGVPLRLGQKKASAFHFIRDRVWDRIQSWKARFLSREGKLVLLKSVIQSIPQHCMLIYLLPSSICKDIQRMMNSYLWGNNRGKDKSIH